MIKKRGQAVHRAKSADEGGPASPHLVTKEDLKKHIRFLKALVLATDSYLEAQGIPEATPGRPLAVFRPAAAAVASPLLLAAQPSEAVRQMSHALWSCMWPIFVLVFVGSALVALVKSGGFKGWIGEAMTRWWALNRLDPKEYRVFHDLYVPRPDGDGTTQIDHLVVSRFGVFVIETKNLGGWLFGREGDVEWTQTFPRRKHQIRNPLRQNFGHVKALQEFLEFSELAFKPVVWMIGNAVFPKGAPAGVLTRGLNSFIVGHRTPSLADEAVETAVARLAALERRTDRKAARHAHLHAIKLRRKGRMA